jgi:hypothetical protein
LAIRSPTDTPSASIALKAAEVLSFDVDHRASHDSAYDAGAAARRAGCGSSFRIERRPAAAIGGIRASDRRWAGATEAAGDPRGLDGLPADAARRELSLPEALALLCDAEMRRRGERRIQMGTGMGIAPLAVEIGEADAAELRG